MKGYKRDILLLPTMKTLKKQLYKTPVFMRVSRVAMSRIYAIYAKLTPNGAESCAELKQSHILMDLTLMD